MRSISIGAAVLACSVFASTALAGNPLALPTSHEARDHINRGARLYNNRSFEAAIMEFRAGSLIEPVPAFDYNLGQAYRQLGKYKEAIWHYERFLNYGKPTGEALDAVRGWISEMRAHLADRALTMAPTDAASESHSSRATEPSQVVTQRHGTTAQHERTPRDARDESINWAGWTVTVSGVAAMGAAGFLLLRASNLDGQANTDPDMRIRNDLHDQASTRRLVGTVAGIAGLAFTATGIYMLAAYPHRPSTTASLDLGFTGHSVVVFGQF